MYLYTYNNLKALITQFKVGVKMKGCYCYAVAFKLQYSYEHDQTLLNL